MDPLTLPVSQWGPGSVALSQCFGSWGVAVAWFLGGSGRVAAVAGRSSVASLVKVHGSVESFGGWVMRASEFEERYGDYVRRHFQSYGTAHTLRKGVRWRYPFVQVSEGMLKVWIKKYRGPEGVVRVSCVAELADRLGDELQVYSDRYPTAFKLVRALQRRVPPVYLSESAAKTWFSRYGGRPS